MFLAPSVGSARVPFGAWRGVRARAGASGVRARRGVAGLLARRARGRVAVFARGLLETLAGPTELMVCYCAPQAGPSRQPDPPRLPVSVGWVCWVAGSRAGGWAIAHHHLVGRSGIPSEAPSGGWDHCSGQQEVSPLAWQVLFRPVCAGKAV